MSGALADRAAEALCLQVARLAQSCDGGWARRRPGLVAGIGGTPLFGNLNRVTALQPEVDEADLEALVAEVQHLPHMVETRPGDRTTSAWCAARGYTPQAGNPLMAWDLTDSAPLADPPGVRWRRLAAGEVAEHVTVSCLGFEMDRAQLALMDSSTLLDDPLGAVVVGDCDGTPAVTGLSIVEGDWVGVYVIATLPGFRRRGLGAAITSLLVHDAVAAHGVRWSVLQASPLGRPVYAALGYHELESWTRWISP